MKYKKALNCAILLMLLAATNVSLAQQTEANDNDIHSLETDEVQSSLKHKLMGLKSFVAKFDQTVTDAQEELLQNSHGRITLEQPNKMLWEVSEPNENILIADGVTLWHVDPFVEQVVAMDQQKAIINNPIMLLTSPDSEAWKDFVISQSGNVFLVDAKGEESQIARLELVFDDNTLTKLAFVDRQQQRSELTFSDIQQNVDISQEAFVFSLPEGFDLDDQRL